MNKVEDDGITPPPGDAPPAFKTILFLPGATPGLRVAGVPRSEGWVGQCSAAEADDLCQRRLAICLPNDWPALPPPTDGEPFPAYIERAVDRHPAVVAIMRLGEPVGLEAPDQAFVRPGEVTLQKWELEFAPDDRFPWIDAHWRGTVLFHFRRYLSRRLLAQLFDHLRPGTWSAYGHRADDAEYTSQLVPCGLFGHPDMVLHYGPRGDWFRPMQRPGWPTPAITLPSFSGLTLHPKPTAGGTKNDVGAPAPLSRTGAAGRPTSVSNLVAPELERRAAANETLPTMNGEAEELSKWLRKNHPEQPQIAAKGIENTLRDRLRAAVDSAQKRRI